MASDESKQEFHITWFKVYFGLSRQKQKNKIIKTKKICSLKSILPEDKSGLLYLYGFEQDQQAGSCSGHAGYRSPHLYLDTSRINETVRQY